MTTIITWLVTSVYMAIHTWDKIIPFGALHDRGYHIRCISIVPTTERGRVYQDTRYKLCYPGVFDKWQFDIELFNSKQHMQQIDFCTMLVDRNTDGILAWLENEISLDFRHSKVPYAVKILETYYQEILAPMEASYV